MKIRREKHTFWGYLWASSLGMGFYGLAVAAQFKVLCSFLFICLYYISLSFIQLDVIVVTNAHYRKGVSSPYLGETEATVHPSYHTKKVASPIRSVKQQQGRPIQKVGTSHATLTQIKPTLYILPAAVIFKVQ
jgi:hypothetical protein